MLRSFWLVSLLSRPRFSLVGRPVDEYAVREAQVGGHDRVVVEPSHVPVPAPRAGELRVQAREWMLPALRPIIKRYTAAEVQAVFEREGLPYAPIVKPEELFDSNGRFKSELAEIAPKKERRMSANPHANGGLLLRDLRLPDFRKYGVESKKPGVMRWSPKVLRLEDIMGERRQQQWS